MLISTKGKICIDSSYDALQEFRHSPFVLINTYKQLPKSGSLQNKKAYGVPPDPFFAVTKQKRKKATKQKRKKAVWGQDYLIWALVFDLISS